MLKEFETEISRRPNRFVRIINTDTNRLVYDFKNEDLKQHGNLANYLQTVKQQGINNVSLTLRRTNGTTTIALSPTQKFCLSKKESEAKKQQSTQTPEQNMKAPEKTYTATPVYHEPQVPGLMGVGLGQYMEAHSSMRMLQKLEQDYAELKSKYELLVNDKERLKDELVDQKRTNDRLQDKIEGKSILDSIDINAALPLLAGILKPQAAAGLNGTAAKELTGYKSALRDGIENDGTPEIIVEKLFKALQHYYNGNETFVTQFENLIEKHNLQAVKNG